MILEAIDKKTESIKNIDFQDWLETSVSFKGQNFSRWRISKKANITSDKPVVFENNSFPT